MAGQRARASIYKRGGVFWTRFVVLGVEYRRSLRTSDAKAAQRRADELRTQAVAQAHFGDNRIGWKEAVVAWTVHILHEVGANTAKRYGVSIRQMEPDFGTIYIDQIDKAAVSAYIARRRLSKVSNATLRRDLVALSSVLDFAEDQNWREGNPAFDRLKKLKEKREPIVLPEPSDIERVIERAPANFAHMIRAAWLTGCRQEELASAERRRFDRDRAQLTVIGKGRKLRTVPLSPKAVACLSAVLPALGSSVLFHHGGERYRNVASRFREFTVSAQKSAQETGEEFRVFRFHDLRHAFAVAYLKDGGGIYDLQAILGHSSVKVTEMYLAYLTPAEAAAAKMGSAQKADHLQRSATSA